MVVNINVTLSQAKQFNVSMVTAKTILTPTVDNQFEIIKTGNNKGDDDNWQQIIIGDNLHVQYKEAGNWVDSFVFTRQ